MEEKAILFGTVNTEKTNLLKQIESGTSDGDFGLSDSTINEINEKLAVSSFDDFERKFPLGMEKNLYVSLAKLIDDKKQKKYIMTDAQEIFRKMLPISREQIQNLVRTRNNLINLVRKQDLDADITSDLYKQLQKIVSSECDTISLTVCLAEDICNGLQNREENNIDRALASDIPSVPVRIAGKALQPEKAIYHMEQKEQEQYIKLLDIFVREQKDNGEDRGHSMKNQRFFIQQIRGLEQKWEIIMTWLAIPAYISGRNDKKLMLIYDKYSGLYRDICREYWLKARPVVETLLGIKLFFDKAAEKHETKQLLIANVSLRDMEHIKNQQKLDVYLQTTNTKLYDQNRIQEAVIPEIALPDSSAAKEKIQNILEKYRIQVRCSDTKTPKLPVLAGDDAVYTPCPMLAYDEMNRKIRIIPGRQVWFDELGIERIYEKDYTKKDIHKGV